MNLLISYLPELPFLHSKRPKFHKYIELMIKEITQYFSRLVQFWNNHVSANTKEKFSHFPEKKTTEMQNCSRKRAHFSQTRKVELSRGNY